MIILGDFNTNRSAGCCPKKWPDVVTSYDLHQIVSGATRVHKPLQMSGPYLHKQSVISEEMCYQ